MVSLRSRIARCLSADVSENQIIQSRDRQINNSEPAPLHLLELPEAISKLVPDDTELAYPLAKMQEFMLHHYSILVGFWGKGERKNL
ncbi:hypothetical protein NSTC745_04794 [Nostoc sp. DSM 114161]|uniref:hypothetical protein n=1 Tax=Nostoc sp. DSM 114161 TaxID=3440143 RepID=UPI004045725C